MGDHVSEQSWKIGDLAADAGLTVRTLHHFDQLGLLRPVRRSPAGHRVYTADDVRRLHRILTLRRLGVPLGRIAESLDGDVEDLAAAVRAQLVEVQRHLDVHHRARARLSALLPVVDHAVDHATELSTDKLLEAMEILMDASYFTPEQLAQAKRRHTEPGFAATFAQWQRRGTEIADEISSHVERGTDPADPAVQELARRWAEVMRDMAGGDRTVISSMYAKIEGKGPEAATRGVLTPTVWDYLKRAFVVGYSANR